MARIIAVCLGIIVFGSSPPHVARAGVLPTLIQVIADYDDDDGNGIPDGQETFVAKAARVDTVALDDGFVGTVLAPESGAEHIRILVDGRPLRWGVPIPRGAVVQGLTPGVAMLEVHRVHAQTSETTLVTVYVIAVGLRDGEGRDVDFTRSHASLDRTPPTQVTGDAAGRYDAVDPLRLFVVSPYDTPPSIGVESVTTAGTHLDSLSAPSLTSVGCPEDAPLHCFASDPIRFVIDDVDRRHALAAGRSIRAELGGAIVLRREGKKEQAIRVLGPRDSPAGPIGRLRATLRPVVLRLAPGGVPAIGGNDPGALALLRAELTNAAAAWGECGVSFGPPDEIAARLVDPPPSHLLAVGDDVGLPASGGHLRFRIDGQKTIDVATHQGELPLLVARAAAQAIEDAGFTAVLSPNARVSSGANPSVDVSVRRRSGALARLEPVSPGAVVSDDGSLTVRIGVVDLSDGLAHFGDMDAAAGTLEERTLLKAFDDGDPSTIEVVIIPFFTGGSRIGESFIGTDRSSLRNVVLLDRAGVRARRSSLTLAHELGHVLLDIPGHPDDYGVDTPTRLMDADAADASPFGPRRLTLAECARVVRESGPGARSPLLHEWPLTPLAYPDAPMR